MKRAIVAIAALLAAACGGSSTSPITAQEAADALPASSQIKMSAAPTYQATQLSERSALAVAAGTTAPYAVETFLFSTSVNVSVVAFLDVMGAIPTLFPPTSCAGDTCTWGPGHSRTDPLDYQLQVTKVADDDYQWKFQGRPLTSTSTADFKTLASGEAFTTAQKHVGHGTMLADFDAAAALQPGSTDSGTIAVTYKNDDPSQPRTLSVAFRNVNDHDNPGYKVNVNYAYSDGTAGGDVQLAARSLAPAGTTLQLHTRWIPGGAGRGDGKVTQGTNQFSESQCWGAFPTFALGYQEDGGVPTAPFTSSDLTACGSFDAAVLPSIALP